MPVPELVLISIACCALAASVWFWLRHKAEERAVTAPAPKAPVERPAKELPRISYEEDGGELDLTKVAAAAGPASTPPQALRILYDDEAAVDEPTQNAALILVTATAQTDPGKRRRRNEDSMLVDEANGIFVVADGMGGYRGGEVASQLAVTTIEKAFSTGSFQLPANDQIPRRAGELASAIQMANEEVLRRAAADKQLEGMGTTICAARFSPNKQRLYVGHVGDSRAYCLRDGVLSQMTSDHTMKAAGIGGAIAQHLSRAVGVWPVVPVDIVLGKPRPDDVYLLCSDGLSKMVDDDTIAATLRNAKTPADAAQQLVDLANENGGKDNVTVIVIRVADPGTKSVAA
jgi:PPM family protein phosphatase